MAMRHSKVRVAALSAAFLCMVACAGAEEGRNTMATLTVRSSAFGPGALIPVEYTGEGKNVSPPLEWSGVPASARELALICDDPDAPSEEPWVHWVAYKIPASTTSLPEGARSGFVAGRNDFGQPGYGGPMPPRGHGVHHYHFKLYALDHPLDAAPGLGKSAVLEAIRGHVVADGELIGTYERK
jgi:Raf kinase inhibitor-like YbhB/YbcL family protein